MHALTDLLQRLVAIPSPNPPGDCHAVAQFCARYLADAGFEVTLVAPDDRAWSVVASIGPDTGSSLLYHAHIDTVPLGQNAHWTHDPFGGECVDGKLYGLGSVDDKGPMAAMLLVGALLGAQRAQIRGRLTIVCAAEE